jgi:hypothetical protein
MDTAELVRLAKVGAAARLQAIRSEVAAIFKQFPGLRAGSRDSGLGGSQEISRRGKTPAQPVKKARRSGLSAAGRRAIRLAQKKRWAEWKAAQTKRAADTQKEPTTSKRQSTSRAGKKR